MKWWHDAKFGMFIHFGLYAAHGRHEWAMEDEAVPVSEYQKLTAGFNPAPGTPRKWAQLAKAAGMKYMVLTSKHHEGFCNWDTKLTNYNAVQYRSQARCHRGIVEAARAEGLRVGFYYSLMDWHHPDGARCPPTMPPARRRFVDYTHGLIRELMTNYGKIDILWYDVSWPLDAEGLGIGKDEPDGVRAAARHHRQQPQPPGGRFLHPGTDHPGRRAAGAPGKAA